MANTTDRAQYALSEVKKNAGDLAATAGDKAGVLASKAGEKAGDLAAKASEKAGDLAVKAGDMAGEFAVKAGDKANELAAKAKSSDLAGRAGELADKARSQMPDEMRDAADKVVTKARTRPWATAAVAAGAFLVWRMLRRKKQS
ncbi:hypothetical protein Sme01_68690 [Sphaerisporangium melleum]|uniref:CsbD-like domain-containing protein n=1 Tax=Sphaerisporangium melleum TaxID=321316 RepID=A0A917RKP6_9ACTN|nr:hypothetical protein [Sphaerisporangium melleum]GGL12159.1 hypothetical protein GCM10007964_62720 [Sphaerisporangium melleum]GII74393.1 hypothetical protein Sme01_68690 [Sphaerisporangium melleum]